MKLHRRSFLTAASVAALPFPARAQDLSRGMFTHGVASGDPLPGRVMLWTRFAHQSDGAIGWEVSEDETFARPVASGRARASLANDYCVKVDVGGLQPGRRYFYRFLSASGPSVTGLTRTAPQGRVDSLNIALFSCSNLPFGYFHAYGDAAARDEIELVLHVGDYIYEVHRGSYPSPQEAVPGRVIDPVGELVTLSDYYQRYACYHTDSDLLELRRLKPMSVVWDDHEIANDTWRNGAQAHDPQTQGPFAAREAAATKAYFDWMPIRRPDPRGIRIYRSLDWGDLARIVLLDTRLIDRDKQLDYRTQLAPQLAQGGQDAARLVAEFRRTLLDDPNRSMMGRAQEQWFAQTLAQSTAAGQAWQIIAQQVVMGEIHAPQGMTRFLPDDIGAGARQWFAAGEQMSALGLPWNLDCWNGYPAARARFLEACVANANNALVLGGDSHNCWIYNHTIGERRAAVEFGGGSVTSPGFERSLSNAGPGERETAIRAVNPTLAWCDLTYRGYGAMRITRAACEAEWRSFESVREPQAPAPRVTRFTSEASAAAGPGAWAVST